MNINTDPLFFPAGSVQTVEGGGSAAKKCLKENIDVLNFGSGSSQRRVRKLRAVGSDDSFGGSGVKQDINPVFKLSRIRICHEKGVAKFVEVFDETTFLVCGLKSEIMKIEPDSETGSVIEMMTDSKMMNLNNRELKTQRN